MGRSPVNLMGSENPLLNIRSLGRASGLKGGFSRDQIEIIARTVRRTPEVMVKVTGGGTQLGAVAAHLSYISRKGELDIETDSGERLGREEQKTFLDELHLELSTGQYRGPRAGQRNARRTKLVHNIALSMPSPTSPEKVLAASRKFAREKFGAKHRYALVLHTDQQHPHVHLVVKAEDNDGRRLHIDKDLLRAWREDFARLMREQGVAANAAPRVVRGRSPGSTKTAIFRATRRGKSTAMLDRVTGIVRELAHTGTIRDPARPKVIETRKKVLTEWEKTALILDAQGEIELAGDVRYFARKLQQPMTDKEELAMRFLRHREKNRVQNPQRSQEKADGLKDFTR